MRAVNLVLYLAMCGLIGTGALLTWRLPPGSRGGKGLEVLGFDRHIWGDIHFWIGLVFVLAGLLHLALNWPWLKKIAASRHLWKLALGLGLGLIIISGIFFLPVVDLRGP